MDKVQKTSDITEIVDNRDIIVVTHQKDMDGMCSAAIAIDLFGSRISRVMFSDFELPAIEKLSHMIEGGNFKNSVILFSDLSFNDSAIGIYSYIFSLLKHGNNYIVWLDHHPISDKVGALLADNADYLVVGENKDFCGAELVAEYIAKPLKKYSSKIELIAHIAHISDFALRNTDFDKKLDKASFAIASYLDDESNMQDGLFKIARAIENDPNDFDNDNFITERSAIYEAMQNKLKEELRNSIRQISFGAHKAFIGFNFSGSLQTNDACNYILSLPESKGAEMVIYVKAARGTCHIRIRNDSEIDSLPLANAMGGNGHSKASAFPVPHDIDLKESNGIMKLISIIEDKLKTLYKSTSNDKNAV